MHYALPQRKSSRPPYAIKLKQSSLQFRRIRPTSLIAIIAGFITLFLLLRSFGFTHSGAKRHYGGRDVVIVTAYDENTDSAIAESVMANRQQYAKLHDYGVFFTSFQNYSVKSGPPSWAKVPVMRHAMTVYPQATFFFYLDAHALIANTKIALEKHVLDGKTLESLMITDVPIVPPDSVIKTFAGLDADRVDIIITQDKEGLSEKSFILRRGEWAKYFLDAWYDPLYRTYNFQRAERHALEHIVQWHGTILAKLALIPQKVMNSYHEKYASAAAKNGVYTKDDFIINFGDCTASGRNCESEMRPYIAHDTGSGFVGH